MNGVGTITAVLASSWIVNPNNYHPSIKSIRGDIEYNYYSPEVADNIPKMFIYFIYAEVVILALTLYFVWIPPYELEKEDEIKLPINVEQSA
jgi:hypothetical protein